MGATVVGNPAATVIDLAAGRDAPLVQLPGGQGGERQQVGGRARHGQPAMLQAEARRQRALEFGGIAAGGQPHVERGVEQMAQVVGVEHLAGAGNVGLAGDECPAALSLGEEIVAQRQDLLA